MHERRYELPYSWCCREGLPLASSDTVHPPKSRPTKKRCGANLPQHFLSADDVAGFFIAAFGPSVFEGSPPLCDLFASRLAASVALAPTGIDGCRSPKRYESLDAKTWSLVWRLEIRVTESIELSPLISARNLVMPRLGKRVPSHDCGVFLECDFDDLIDQFVGAGQLLKNRSE